MGTKKKPLAKSAFDMSHVKGVSVVALLSSGKYAGKIVANHSDNPNGSVCTCTVVFFEGRLKHLCKATGTAGGYGYDKFSAAFSDAIDRAELEDPRYYEGHDHTYRPDTSGVSGAGFSRVKAFLEAHGYSVLEVV